jgi:hypothetical protein
MAYPSDRRPHSHMVLDHRLDRHGHLEHPSSHGPERQGFSIGGALLGQHSHDRGGYDLPDEEKLHEQIVVVASVSDGWDEEIFCEAHCVDHRVLDRIAMMLTEVCVPTVSVSVSSTQHVAFVAFAIPRSSTDRRDQCACYASHGTRRQHHACSRIPRKRSYICCKQNNIYEVSA